VNSGDLLRLDSQLCFLLYATTRAVTQAYAPLLEPLGLTYPQYLVMLVLWEEDEATLGRIGERLQLDSGTLTPLIKRMEAAGLVTRERSREDERVLKVRLTDEGRRLRTRATGVPVQMFCQAGLSVTSADRLATDLRRVLSAVRNAATTQSHNDNNRATPTTPPPDRRRRRPDEDPTTVDRKPPEHDPKKPDAGP
jgi:MarR family transcriptional regulator, organic hydroperoxide resistance regulator